MVANCRVKTATSLGLMRSVRPGMTISVLRPSPPAGVTETGRYPISRSRPTTRGRLSPSSFPSIRFPDWSLTL